MNRSDVLTGLHVLVVDDDADLVTTLNEVLTRAGARVTATTSVNDAMVEFSQTRPDVIVSDLAMPGTDGYQFIRMIRARRSPDGVAVPAIALTGTASDATHSRAILLGFQSFLAKPVSAEALVETVRALARPSG